jgi:hypothetical protein
MWHESRDGKRQAISGLSYKNLGGVEFCTTSSPSSRPGKQTVGSTKNHCSSTELEIPHGRNKNKPSFKMFWLWGTRGSREAKNVLIFTIKQPR